MSAEEDALKLPEKFRDMVACFPEYSFGVNKVKVHLSDGRRIYAVFVAGDGVIVKIDNKKIESPEDLGFKTSEIIDVISEIRSF